MNLRSGGASALKRVDPTFQTRDVRVAERRLFDTRRDPMTRVGEHRTEREKIPLNVLDHRCECRVGTVRAHEAENRRDFIDVAVRLDARIGLRHARPVKQSRLTAVTGARVDGGGFVFHGCGRFGTGAGG